MIAQVIPLRRLPRQIAELSYTIPDSLLPRVQPGQVVVVPFRAGTVVGLVSAIKNEDDVRLKSITSLLNDTPLLSSDQIQLLMQLATIYGVSLGHIAGIMLPPIQKRKIAALRLPPCLSLPPAAPEQHTVHWYKTQEERIAFLSAMQRGTTLIVVPTIRAADDLKKALHKLAPTVFHSGLSQKEQFSAWQTIRSAQTSLVIGTRGSVFLPFQTLSTIIIDEEHHREHKHWDQAPRYHAKDIAQILSKRYGASLHFASYSPSLASYFAAHKGLASHNFPETFPGSIPTPIIADRKREGRHVILTYQAEEAIRTSNKDVFVYLNRVAGHGAIGCMHCGSTLHCPNCHIPMRLVPKNGQVHCSDCGRYQPVPKQCSTCQTPLTQLPSLSTQEIEREIKRLFPEKDERDIVRIDSTNDTVPALPDDPCIIVGSSMAIPLIRWHQTDTIIFVDLDFELTIPEYSAAEDAWHLVQTMQYYREPQSSFVIQTRNTDHLLFKGLSQPDYFYRMELNMRRALLYPPYGFLVRLMFGSPNAEFSKKEAERVHKLIETTLTKEPKKLKLGHPMPMAPKYYRGQFWYTILVKSEPNLWQENILFLTTHLPSNWKIDPDPNSILRL